MKRGIPILSGLAILGIVLNHANWHVLEQFLAGDPRGYPFIIIDNLGKFGVATFVFIAGYFLSYTTNYNKEDLKWKILKMRLIYLILPWVIWSVIYLVIKTALGETFSLNNLLVVLFEQYYFVPLLIFYYLLSLVIFRFTKNHAKELLIVTMIVQAILLAIYYIRIYNPNFPEYLKASSDIGLLLYGRFFIFFVLGLTFKKISQKIEKSSDLLKKLLPILTLVFFIASVLEAIFNYNKGVNYWPLGNDQTRLTTVLFSLSLILTCLYLEKMNVFLTKTLILLSKHSYGVYLTHYIVLSAMAKLFEKFLPWITLQNWLYGNILFILTIVSIVGALVVFVKLPTKKIYKYVFG